MKRYRMLPIHSLVNRPIRPIIASKERWAAASSALRIREATCWFTSADRLNTCATTRLSSAAIFDGILRASGYTHCAHPWPYFRQHRVDHRIVERWVKSPGKCTTDGLLPLSEGRLRLAGDALFIRAAEFFAAGGERSETFDRALWLLHSSNPTGMAFEVRVLILCRGYRTGAEVGYVNLRRWFFCDTGMSSGSTFQQFNHAWRIGASNDVDGDFDRALSIRKGPVSHLTRDERSIRNDDFGTVRSANNVRRCSIGRCRLMTRNEPSGWTCRAIVINPSMIRMAV